MNNKARLPWFGLDIGGSLVKLVYFEPCSSQLNCKGQERVGLEAIQDFIKSNVHYGEEGRRDEDLAMEHVVLGDREGHLHFIRFPTDAVDTFLSVGKELNAFVLNNKVCATGGGAFKFEKDFREVLGVQLVKYDELECLVNGIHFINSHSVNECYYWNNLHCVEKSKKVSYDFQNDAYPYLVVNIGSGVSVLLVESAENFSRISGTSFGKMTSEGNRSLVKDKDLARAMLVTITNNIGSIARMCAVNHKVERVVFVGNFLRGNTIAMKLLAFAMDYWSEGTMKALFLKHEGYFGASGALLELMTRMKENQNGESTD
ncbi:pantothenate kinase 3-like isoform X2 [Montipora foliosa]|uniref:pantothenate kinase 3-like isoform X2 n=1 Tax=Montipora foliosa TaxID=591990 RepID=UPI0035F101E5